MNPSVQQHGVKSGVSYAIVGILWTLYAYLFDSNVFTQTWTSIIFLFISLGFYIYGVAKVKKDGGGFISFKDAFSAFMVAAITASAITTVFSILLMSVIDPEFAELVYDNIKIMAIERMESQNVPDEMVQTMMERLDENNPFELWSQVKNFFFGTAFSAILGLIVAAAMKKRNPEELV